MACPTNVARPAALRSAIHHLRRPSPGPPHRPTRSQCSIGSPSHQPPRRIHLSRRRSAQTTGPHRPSFASMRCPAVPDAANQTTAADAAAIAVPRPIHELQERASRPRSAPYPRQANGAADQAGQKLNPPKTALRSSVIASIWLTGRHRCRPSRFTASTEERPLRPAYDYSSNFGLFDSLKVLKRFGFRSFFDQRELAEMPA